ncbi:MAG: hypothetical protein ACYSTR_02415 [Planctomycetota bacterium]
MALTFIMLIPGLLIALALLAGFIVLLVKGGAGVRWFFAILLLLTVIGFFGLFSMRVRKISETHVILPSNTTAAVSVSQGTAPEIVKSDVVWRQGLEEELVPDVYSGTKIAAYGLGVQLQETFAALPQMPKRIVIAEGNGEIDIVLLEQLRRGLKFILPDVDIVIASEAPEGQVWISLQLKDVESRQIETPEIQNADAIRLSQLLQAGSRGVLQAVVQSADNKYAKQVEFDNCLWLYHTEKFRSSAIGHRWAVIASKETAVTKEQAIEKVAEAARQYLTEQVGMQNIQKIDLRDCGFIVDEYTQRLQGLSGPIWRAAVLLELSPERLQKLGRDKTVVIRNVRKTWAYHIFSLVGMILLIGVLSMLVNALTKGYYSTVIAIVAIGLVGTFVLLMMLA